MERKSFESESEEEVFWLRMNRITGLDYFYPVLSRILIKKKDLCPLKQLKRFKS